ncbi:MAG TPA: hypothetical protein VK966_06390, partial [Longimicrobiales bacterium]|nr:hypothetical protein [Longimicrobiales bacterium]
MVEFPLDPRVEAAFGARGGDTSSWTWTDITGDLLGGVPVELTHGRQDEQSTVAPSEATLTLRDPHGHYMPGNPLSPHYPHVAQGVPLRVRLAGMDADHALRLPGMLGSYGITPPHASLDVGLDFD